MKYYLLLGNPNVGKTTIFNHLTGQNEKIGNYEGATYHHKEGIIKNTKYRLVDFPGINSLSENSTIEKALVEELLTGKYSGIYYVCDITNFKKNLYMLIDLLTLKKPINILLNMSDLYDGEVKVFELSNLLHAQCYLTNKNKNFSFSDINIFSPNNFNLVYSKNIEQLIVDVQYYFQSDQPINQFKHFISLQLILGNQSVEQYFTNVEQVKQIIAKVEKEIIDNNEASSLYGAIFVQKRNFITQVLHKSLEKSEPKNKMQFMNKYFDKIALHKFWGYILFLMIMLIVFSLTFRVDFITNIIEQGLINLTQLVEQTLIAIQTPEILISFIIEGVFAGISSIIVFLPQIIILFTLLTLLEGIGYFSRVSVLFENLFNKIGLSAHSLIPLLSGLGCNVLSIMSTRTIKNEKKRLATIFAAPYISCAARFPIYIIFINVFFEKYQGLILLSIYLFGIIIAIFVAYIVDKVILRDKSEMGIITLPPYKTINLKYFGSVLRAKIKGFINNAGKLILIGTLVTWILVHFSKTGYTTDITTSFLYNFAHYLSILLTPLGFGTTEAGFSLIGAFFAKELAVGAMQVAYQVSNPSELQAIISQTFTLASAYSFMIFTLLYIPCISTLGVIYSETKKVSYVIYSIIGSLALGYVSSWVVYHILTLFT